MIPAILGTFALIFVAELGDKTQLLVAWMATRHRKRHVMAGVFVGSAAIHLISAAVGGVVGEYVPGQVTGLIAGLLFLGFGVWALVSGGKGLEGERERTLRSPVLAIAATFFLAELGDKTQLVALSRAAQYGASPEVGPQVAFWAVWIGATAGMLVADGAAVLAGSYLAGRFPRAMLARLSGVVFLVFGGYTLVTTFV